MAAHLRLGGFAHDEGAARTAFENAVRQAIVD
jgi:hypothetical protein